MFYEIYLRTFKYLFPTNWMYFNRITDFNVNDINDQQEVININNAPGWINNPMAASHDIMIPVPIKMQQSLGVLNSNNLTIHNSCQHTSVIHTSPQTPHVCFVILLNVKRFTHINMFFRVCQLPCMLNRNCQ